jgi:DNA-binding IclR family transcriptional regulator
MPAKEVEQSLEGYVFRAYTRHTFTDKKRFLAELALVRQRGSITKSSKKAFDVWPRR